MFFSILVFASGGWGINSSMLFELWRAIGPLTGKRRSSGARGALAEAEGAVAISLPRRVPASGAPTGGMRGIRLGAAGVAATERGAAGLDGEGAGWA